VVDLDSDLAPLLARAGILMFEYDADAFLITALGSCLGGPTPDVEVRSGITSPDSVRRALSGEMVVDRVEVAGRTIAVHHEPVRSDGGRVERVLVTAFDVGIVADSRDPLQALLAALPGAQFVKPLHMTERPA